MKSQKQPSEHFILTKASYMESKMVLSSPAGVRPAMSRSKILRDLRDFLKNL